MMKHIHSWLICLLAVIAPLTARAQNASSEELERVLKQMDNAAANFRTTEASFVWDQYQKVVDETDTQKGKVYFRRQGQEIQMAADIAEPDAKYVLFSGGKAQIYQPRIDQVTVYDAGKSRSDFESFLVLGFGGGGHDMLKSFEVKYLGAEKVLDTDTAKLELVPKSQKVRNTFERILLWIDPARGVSVQQQLIEPSGDYRLAKYSEIQLNQKISDNVFKLKTTGKTKIVSPQG
jgi:outer membrane lipoprotein-sorting protein